MMNRKVNNLGGFIAAVFMLVAAQLFVSVNTYAKELPDFTELVEKNGPAVVNVRTKTRTGNRQGHQQPRETP